MSYIRQINSLEEKEQIMQFLRTNTYPSGLNTHQKKTCRRKAGAFEIVNSLLCFKIGDGRFKRAVFEFKR
jgi:hypothetical protein